MNKMASCWNWLLGLLLATSGCDGPAPSQITQPPKVAQLHVAAASDLQSVLPKLVERYQATRPGTHVILTFGSSGQLAEQIKAGAPFDLFLAANRTFVSDLATQGRIVPESVRPYAVGSLVLAVHRERTAKLEIGELADLLNPGIKSIAIANPEFAPYGAAAKQALNRAGLWEAVAPKLVYAENIRQTLQFVQTGNAEVGLVSRATADVPEVRVIEVDSQLYDPIEQSLGIVARSPHVEEAEPFCRFLIEGKGRAILEAHGFKRPVATGHP